MSSKLSFREFMEYSDVSELLTEDILVFLENLAPLSDKDVRVVAKLSSGEIAQLISVSKPELKRKSMAYAIEILSRLRAAGYKEEDRNVPSAQQPQQLVLKPTIEQMGLPDLISLCFHDLSKKREAWGILSKKEEYIAATKKTSALAWVINGNLDIERTVNYIFLMSDPLTVKQIPKRDKGERLISLPEALGIETRSYFHPLTGKVLRGPDQYGIDWVVELSPEYHQAAIWALVDPTCHIHPGDSYNNALELLKGEGVWSLIMAQYWQALDENNSYAKSVSIYADTKTNLDAGKKTYSATQSVKVTQEDENYYRELLLAQSLGNESLRGYNKKITGIYNHLNVSGYNQYLDRVVCLQGLNISGYDNSGTVILPPGKKVSNSGYQNNVNIERCKSWREVAIRAELI